MAQNDMQKAIKRWNKRMRELKRFAHEGDRKNFLKELELMQESLSRMESKMKTEESEGFKQIELFT